MTRPGTASEPTMDEILASIRKIIAEDPQAKASGEPTFAALAPQPAPSRLPRPAPAHANGTPADRPGALMDRIATAVRSAPETAAAPERGDVLYSDLDDMLADAPPSANGSGAPHAPRSNAGPAPAAPQPSAPMAPLARNEPSFSSAAMPQAQQPFPAARSPFPPAGPANGRDPLGPLVAERFDAPHAGSVASRLPPLGGAPLSADLGPFAVVRPPQREEPLLPDPQAAANGRLASASWPDTLRRAEAAADEPAEPVLPMPAAQPAGERPSEPVVLAAMSAPSFPPLKSSPAFGPKLSGLSAAPLPPQPSLPPFPVNAASEPDNPSAASEPVVLAAMPPLKGMPLTAAKPVPPPPAAAAEPKPAADGLSQTLADITRLGAAAQPINFGDAAQPGSVSSEKAINGAVSDKPHAAADTAKPFPFAGAAQPSPLLDIAKPMSDTAMPFAIEPKPGAATADAMPVTSGLEADHATSAPIAPDADTNAAVASALGALAAGLAASSNKSAAVMPPATKPDAPAVKREASPLPQAAPGQPDIVAGLAAAAAQRPHVSPAAGTSAPRAAPSASVEPLEPPPSEAFLALAQGEPAPIANLPSLIHSGALEPETALDDTVAELLRPMLRQWLAENMPRIVEKALRIELAEGLRAEPEPNPRR